MAVISILIGVFLAAFTLVGILGNSLVFTVVCWNRTLGKPLNLFLFNLALSDLGMGCTCVPFAVAMFISNDKGIAETFCYVNAFLVTLFAITSALLILSLCVFQYLMVTAPLDRSVSGLKSCALISTSWLCALAISIGPLLGWGQYQFSSNVFGCEYVAPGKIEMISYNVTLLLFGYIFPLFLMIFCYTCILKTLRDHDVRMSKSAVLASSVRGPEETPQRKLRLTVLLIFLAFFAFRTPFFIDILIRTVFQTYWHSLIGQMSFWSIYIHAAMDPFIYALRHGEYKGTIAELSNFVKLSPCCLCCTQVEEGKKILDDSVNN